MKVIITPQFNYNFNNDNINIKKQIMIPRYVTVSKENLVELEKEILGYKKLGFKIYGELKKVGKYYIQIMHNYPNQ